MSTFTTEDLKGLKKDELLALCEEEGLEVDESLKVSEIKDVLLEVSEEEAEEETDSEEPETEENEEGTEEEEEEEEEEEAPEAPEGQKAYKCAQGNVKFEGKLYKRGEYIITQENPEFESLVEQGILTC